MAKELLPGQELDGGRYVVKKTITFEDDGGVYTAKDTQSGETRIVKEMIPPASMAEEELAERVASIQEAMLVLTQFDHPGLSKIYGHFSEGRRQYVVMEKVEGITLQQVAEMSVSPLGEEQVLRWAVDLCDGLHYLHDRPRPYVFEQIDAAHLVMTSDQTIKVIHYGVDQFFRSERTTRFSGSREELAREMKAFAETLVFLLTKAPPGPFGLMPGEHNLSEDTARVINRCLTGDFQRVYPSYAELGKALHEVLHPPEKMPVERRDLAELFKDIFKPPNWERMYNEAIYRFFRQPLWVVLTELLLAAGLAGLLYYLTHLPIVPRTVAAAYVACGSEVWVVGAESREVLTRIPLGEPIQAVAATPDGRKVFAASAEARRLHLINGISNQPVGVIPTDRGPSTMAMDPLGEWLFVLHPERGMASIVAMDPSPLPEVLEPGFRSKDKVVGVLNVGRDAEGIALDPGPAPDPEAAEPPPRQLRLFLTSRKARRVMSARPVPPPEILGQANLTDPGPCTLSPDGKLLYVAEPTLDQVAVLDAATLQPRGKRIVQTGGRGLVALLFRPGAEEEELWCVSREGGLGIIDPRSRELRSAVPLDGQPSSARFARVGQDVELWVTLAKGNAVAVVNPLSREVKARRSVGREPSSLWLVPAP